MIRDCAILLKFGGAMYLSKRKIHALELALEAMENYGVYSDVASDAMDAIAEILSSARAEKQKREIKRQRKTEVSK